MRNGQLLSSCGIAAHRTTTALAALSLLLASCGGGGNSPSPAATPPPTPTPTSVYNAPAQESLTLADVQQIMAQGVAEAKASQRPAVIAVVAEERPAPAYDGWIDDVPFSYTLALRLSRAVNGPRWRLSLGANDGAAPVSDLPHALRFVRAMHDGAPLDHPWKTRRWTWQPIA